LRRLIWQCRGNVSVIHRAPAGNAGKHVWCRKASVLWVPLAGLPRVDPMTKTTLLIKKSPPR